MRVFCRRRETLWAGRVITLGTLFAVFLSTSDEMLPILLAEQVPFDVILKIIGAKIVIGMVMGFIVDAALRIARRIDAPLHIHELCEHDHCHCHDGEGGILKSAVKHTLQVTVFIFVITIVLNAVLEVVGEDVLAESLAANPALSVFGSALVGLVPNCAASVVIAQLYVEGVLGSGAMLAGLLRVGRRGPARAGAHEPSSARKCCHHRGPVRDGRRVGTCRQRLGHRVLTVRCRFAVACPYAIR